MFINHSGFRKLMRKVLGAEVGYILFMKLGVYKHCKTNKWGKWDNKKDQFIPIDY